EGAGVRLGDRAVGKTPVVLKGVKPGPHTLTLSKDGFLPVTLRIEVTGGADLGTVPLAKKGDLITAWRVGSRLVPAAQAPAQPEALVKAAGFRLRVVAYSAEDFLKAFRKAASEPGHFPHLPDRLVRVHLLGRLDRRSALVLEARDGVAILHVVRRR